MRTVELGEVLRFAGKPERVSKPESEAFVTVRLNCRGAVRRNIGAGKTPVAFTGYRVRSGQFIYSRIDARNGAFAIVPPELNGAVVSKDFPIFDIRTEVVDTRYLIHFFTTGRLQRQIQTSSLGATNRQRISEDRFLAFGLPLPNLDEQRRIATILDHADALRAKRRRVIAQFDNLAQSIFVDTFGSPADWPNLWPMGTIRDMVENVQYGTSGKAGSTGKWPILRMGNVTDDGRLDVGDLKWIDLADPDVPKFTVQWGDLLFNRTNSKEKVGKTCVVSTDKPFAFAGYLVRVRLKPAHRVEFLNAYMTSRYGRAVRFGMAKAAVNQANINATEMQSIPVALPPEDVQEQFATSLTRLEIQRDRQFRSLLQLDELFASLQSRAFRGEL